jgi:hypothetical protein
MPPKSVRKSRRLIAPSRPNEMVTRSIILAHAYEWVETWPMSRLNHELLSAAFISLVSSSLNSGHQR